MNPLVATTLDGTCTGFFDLFAELERGAIDGRRAVDLGLQALDSFSQIVMRCIAPEAIVSLLEGHDARAPEFEALVCRGALLARTSHLDANWRYRILD